MYKRNHTKEKILKIKHKNTKEKNAKDKFQVIRKRKHKMTGSWGFTKTSAAVKCFYKKRWKIGI